MKTVYTKDELREALKAGETKLLCKGQLERSMRKARRRNARLLGVASMGLAAALLMPILLNLGHIYAGVMALRINIFSANLPLAAVAGSVVFVLAKCLCAFNAMQSRKPRLTYTSEGVEYDTEKQTNP